MPDTLRWRNMTPAEHVTLPTYPTAAIIAGLLYIFQSDTRLSGPAFETAKTLWSMDIWGAIFLCVGIAQWVCLAMGRFQGSRWVYTRTLYAGVVLSAFWSVLLFRSAQESPFVSYTAALWLAVITVLQIASSAQLARGGPRA